LVEAAPPRQASSDTPPPRGGDAQSATSVKEYLFSVQFGFETDTLDITGKVINETNVIPTEKQIREACAKLIGEIEQVPPQYSAVHVAGRRAHELARAGKPVEIPPRRVQIYELKVEDTPVPCAPPRQASPDTPPSRGGDIAPSQSSTSFRVVCSRGTYVRSIARDIAGLCGTVATVDMIRRVKTNGLDIKNAIGLDFLENLFNNGLGFKEYLKPVDFGLGDIPVQNLDENDAKLFQNGGFIAISDQESGTGVLRRIYHSDKFIGIGFLENGLLKPKRVINY
jgi:tRNA pseudouridine55 synthase